LIEAVENRKQRAEQRRLTVERYTAFIKQTEAKKMNTKRKIYGDEAKHLRRFATTAIAVCAVIAAVVIKAKLLGEFAWHVGW
jgi:hypothetical protein